MNTLRSFLLTAGTLFGLQAVYGGYVYFQMFSWMMVSGLDVTLGIVASLLAANLLMTAIGSCVYCINSLWKCSISGWTTPPELSLERAGGVVFMSVMSSACLGSFALCGGHDGIGIESPLEVTAAILLPAYAICITLSAWKISVYHRLMSKV